MPITFFLLLAIATQASLAHLGAAANGERTAFQRETSAGLRYRVLRPHAKGELGEIFIAEDTEVHRHVALKEMQERHAADPASTPKFRRAVHGCLYCSGR